MASARELHADWLGVGREELCRRVVSRSPSAEGGFALALTTLPPVPPRSPRPAPRAEHLFIIHVFYWPTTPIESGSPRNLHNGDRFNSPSKRLTDSSRFHVSFVRVRCGRNVFCGSGTAFPNLLVHFVCTLPISIDSRAGRRITETARPRETAFRARSTVRTEKCTQGWKSVKVAGGRRREEAGFIDRGSDKGNRQEIEKPFSRDECLSLCLSYSTGASRVFVSEEGISGSD